MKGLMEVIGSWVLLCSAWNHMQDSGLPNQGLNRPGTLPAIWFPLKFPMPGVGWVYKSLKAMGGWGIYYMQRMCSFCEVAWFCFFFDSVSHMDARPIFLVAFFNSG